MRDSSDEKRAVKSSKSLGEDRGSGGVSYRGVGEDKKEFMSLFFPFPMGIHAS